jgi:hypothetical protein
MGDQKKGAGVWSGAKPYLQQKDKYLQQGMWQALRDALKGVGRSGGPSPKEGRRP